MIGGANAAIITGDDTSIAGASQLYVQPFAVSPSSSSGVALTLDVHRDSGQTQPDVNFHYFIDGTSSETLHTDAHLSFWLLLIVASIFGVVSEVSHRRLINR